MKKLTKTDIKSLNLVVDQVQMAGMSLLGPPKNILYTVNLDAPAMRYIEAKAKERGLTLQECCYKQLAEPSEWEKGCRIAEAML